MLLSDKRTEYVCGHYHHEMQSSARHKMQQLILLRCLVCEKLNKLTMPELIYVNVYILSPYYAKDDLNTLELFHEWLFNA